MLRLWQKAFQVFLIGLSLYSLQLQAEDTCSILGFEDHKPTYLFDKPMSIGIDLPIGSTLYRHRIVSDVMYGFSCDISTKVVSSLIAEDEKVSPIYMDTLDYGFGPVYPTGTPGVGIGLWNAGRLFSKERPLEMVTYDLKPHTTVRIHGFSLDVSLIKIGEISNLGQANINAVTFPSIVLQINNKPGYPAISDMPKTLRKVSFTGAGIIPLLQTTCNILNYDSHVDLGQHEISSHFNSQGRVTPWIDSSIQLADCRPFMGYHGVATEQESHESGTAIGDQRNTNLVNFSIDSLYGIVASTSDVLAIESGSDSASGVGLQLGYTNEFGANSLTPRSLWNTGDTLTFTGSGINYSYTIPLAVRLYQHSNDVSPGKIKGKITFTITYT